MEYAKFTDCIDEWESLSDEYRSLECLHKEYCRKLEELTALQQKCIKGISHQRYRINILKQSISKLDHSNDVDNKEREKLIETDFMRRKAQLFEMENFLPRPNGFYLKIILGNINVSMLDKNDKFKYKDEYEKFKMVMSLITLCISLVNLFTNIRTFDLIHMFLLVWVYCTLTIRESILKVNGSRIKGWWRTHHFISTVLSGVILIWPNGAAYYSFRAQFMAFNVYISFVQYLQFMYQRGCLYRLKALGERHNMDVTVEGFHFWMWKGLGFLLPFLYIGYLWELYNGYTLFLLSFEPHAEWHVWVIGSLFMVLFLGNTFTTSLTIPEKIKERLRLKYRFTRLDKYIWTHKKRRVSFRTPDSPQRKPKLSRRINKELHDELTEEHSTTDSDHVTEGEKSQEESESQEEIEKLVADLAKDINFDEVDKENEEDKKNI